MFRINLVLIKILWISGQERDKKPKSDFANVQIVDLYCLQLSGEANIFF